MYKVKNRMQMMLTVNIPEEDALYFMSREVKELTEAQFNAPETQAYIAWGALIVISVS